MQDTTLHQHCLTIIARLNSQHHWNLSRAQQHAYATAITTHAACSPRLDDGRLSAMVTYYHGEHALVEALRDPKHPEHSLCWAAWTQHAIRILLSKSAGMALLDGAAVSLEDLAQEAMHDLWRGLASYHYQSRFHTWSFTIISHCLARHYRALQTQKRAALRRIHSLDALLAEGATFCERAALQPEEIALHDSLMALMRQVLGQHPDKRLITVFSLWVYEEQPLRTIGEQLNLSVTRVHALLREAILLLRSATAIQTWESDSLAAPAPADSSSIPA